MGRGQPLESLEVTFPRSRCLYLSLGSQGASLGWKAGSPAPGNTRPYSLFPAVLRQTRLLASESFTSLGLGTNSATLRLSLRPLLGRRLNL